LSQHATAAMLDQTQQMQGWTIGPYAAYLLAIQSLACKIWPLSVVIVPS
jgi:hypothetical protein